MGYTEINQVQASFPWAEGGEDICLSYLISPFSLGNQSPVRVCAAANGTDFCQICTSGSFIYTFSDSNSFSSVFANVMTCPFVCMRWPAKETPQSMIIHWLLCLEAHRFGPFSDCNSCCEKKKEAFLVYRSLSYTWIEGPQRCFIFKEQTPQLSLWITIPDESNSFYCHYSRCSHIYPQWPNQSFQTSNKYSRKNTRFYNSISWPWQEKKSSFKLAFHTAYLQSLRDTR